MSLGFKAAGARCLGAVDAEATAAATLAQTLREDEPVVFGGARGDVNDLPVEKLLSTLAAPPDLIIGGPPCQGFSRIGRAKHASLLDSQSRALLGGQADPRRNQLYRYFLASVAKANPLAFVMENVPGMQSLLGVDHAVRISREAASLGYNVRYFLLDAAWYGVPQHRWRLFFVGFRRDLGAFSVPRPPTRQYLSAHDPGEFRTLPDDDWFIHGPDIPTAEGAPPPNTVQDAFADLPRMRGHLKGDRPTPGEKPYRRPPASPFASLMRNWPGAGDEQPTTDGAWYRSNERDFATFRDMNPGDRYPEALAIANRRFQEHIRSLGPNAPAIGSVDFADLEAQFVPPYRNDAFHDKWRKLVPERPSWTVTAHLGKDGYSHIHPDGRQARTISIREAARLQSFPDHVRFTGNNGQQFKQIGNAVPPLLAWAIADSVLSQLADLGALGDWRPHPLPTPSANTAPGS